jgi:CBS domain-containing protein
MHNLIAISKKSQLVYPDKYHILVDVNDQPFTFYLVKAVAVSLYIFYDHEGILIAKNVDDDSMVFLLFFTTNTNFKNAIAQEHS